MKRLAFCVLFIVMGVFQSVAQCAMCRATLENNLSNGNVGLAAGINFGILYLFLAPYTFVVLIAYFWYRTSKKNAQEFDRSTASR